ncbi:hypothetical protein JCM3770_000460 [Rhodotorula araucariae]
MDAPMQLVMPGLWIGDYIAASNHALLDEHGIACVVSSMRQEYDLAPGVNLHRVAVDDTDRTNILEHLVPSADYIHAALENGQSVLVHCQAGVSRSATLVAGYLMLKHGLNVEQALDKIRAARPQVEPSESFLMQLEMFERCNCEWDPVKWPEERRFLMSFAQAEILEGAAPSIVLAYYPSPSVTPKMPKERADSFSLSMLSMPSEQVSPPVSPRSVTNSAVVSTSPTSSSPDEMLSLSLAAAVPTMSAPPARKRLTPRKPEEEEDMNSRHVERPEIERIGTKGQVVVSGRRIRCKMCRRELAAREHIVAHEPGKGQQAFAPNRRDMAAYRAEMEKRRLDEAQRTGAVPLPPTVPAVPPTQEARPAGSTALAHPLAALRISQPLLGVRVVQPRGPPVLRPQPVTRPPPRSVAAPPATGNGTTSAATDVVSQPPSENDASLFPSAAPGALTSAPAPSSPARAIDPPLLPSHVCSSYFVEPLSWMSPILETGVLAGKIICPNKKCGAKLGNFDWAGSQCSCGAWVCPGFALNVSRVDEVTG